MKWAGVFSSLRTFLRPFGNPREGRLDFYHRSFSKTVRKTYASMLHVLTYEKFARPVSRYKRDGSYRNIAFAELLRFIFMCVLLVRYLKDCRTSPSTQSSSESASEVAASWWHQKLADYFQLSGNFERKIQVRCIAGFVIKTLQLLFFCIALISFRLLVCVVANLQQPSSVFL